jgi:DNA replication protein DnaC
LRRLGFIPLIVVDEVGYIPFDPEAANLMFSLVSSRYERASMIVTSNKPFSAWGEISVGMTELECHAFFQRLREVPPSQSLALNMRAERRGWLG